MPQETGKVLSINTILICNSTRPCRCFITDQYELTMALLWQPVYSMSCISLETHCIKGPRRSMLSTSHYSIVRPHTRVAMGISTAGPSPFQEMVQHFSFCSVKAPVLPATPKKVFQFRNMLIIPSSQLRFSPVSPCFQSSLEIWP